MSKHLPTTRWTLVPKPAPPGGAIIRRFSLVPVEAPPCTAAAESAGEGSASD